MNSVWGALDRHTAFSDEFSGLRSAYQMNHERDVRYHRVVPAPRGLSPSATPLTETNILSIEFRQYLTSVPRVARRLSTVDVSGILIK